MEELLRKTKNNVNKLDTLDQVTERTERKLGAMQQEIAALKRKNKVEEQEQNIVTLQKEKEEKYSYLWNIRKRGEKLNFEWKTRGSIIKTWAMFTIFLSFISSHILFCVNVLKRISPSSTVL